MSIFGKMTARSALAGGAFVVALILGAPLQSAAQTPGQNPNQNPNYPAQNPRQNPARTPDQYPSQTNTQRNTSSNRNEPTGKAFIKKIAQINLDEQKLGHLAEQKGNSDAVKDFGKRMVDDHSNAESQLKDVAQKEGVTLPTQPDKKGSKLEQQLSSKSGSQFDQAYLKHMIAGHKQAIALLQHEIKNGKDQDIKEYAQDTLPTIQEHLRLAQQAAGKTGTSGSASGASLQ